MINETHNPAARSWVDSANHEGCQFPLQNLPLGMWRPKGDLSLPRAGMAIGNYVLDIGAACAAGAFEGLACEAAQVCSTSELNGLMRLGQPYWSALRLAVFRGLQEGSPLQAALDRSLIPQNQVEYELPARVGDFTDFYTSIHHAKRAGEAVRRNYQLLPNYDWVPIAYHSRSSSIRISGHEVMRPMGQVRPDADAGPLFAPTRCLDYELEIGVFVGPGNSLGERINLDEAERQIFGVCLLNDLSARDLQLWEAQPLGPFLSKNFATVISPWIVTWEALAPFRCSWERADRAVRPMPYLVSQSQSDRGAINVFLEASLQTSNMQRQGEPPETITRTNAKYMHWTIPQMIAHHTVNGCNLEPGDVIGTGTLSGPELDEAACLLELTDGGRRSLELSNGELRTYLEDGDRIILSGRCEREDFRSIGLGECEIKVAPSSTDTI